MEWDPEKVVEKRESTILMCITMTKLFWGCIKNNWKQSAFLCEIEWEFFNLLIRKFCKIQEIDIAVVWKIEG